MILNHEDGLLKNKTLKQKFNLEIEIQCLNSHFISKEELFLKLNKYKAFAQDFQDICVLKESEFHENSAPYYEMSVFCNEDTLDKFKLVLDDRDIKIDLIHKK